MSKIIRLSVVAALVLGMLGALGLSAMIANAGVPDDTYTIERYYSDNVSVGSTTSTSYVDIVSCSFTPPTTKDYLIVFSALTNNSSTAYSTIVQANINGTGYSETSHRPVDATLNWRSFGGQKSDYR